MGKKIRRRVLLKWITQRKEELILERSAANAGSNATRWSRALGLTVKIIKNNEIVTVLQDRTEKVDRSLGKSSVAISRLRKGLISTENKIGLKKDWKSSQVLMAQGKRLFFRLLLAIMILKYFLMQL